MRCTPDAQPSALWQSRRRGSRIAVADDHADLPALLAEALDVLAQHQFIPAPQPSIWESALPSDQFAQTARASARRAERESQAGQQAATEVNGQATQLWHKRRLYDRPPIDLDNPYAMGLG